MTRPHLTEGLDLLVDGSKAEAVEWRRLRNSSDVDARSALFDRYREFAEKAAIGQYCRIRDMGLDQSDCLQLAYEALLQSIERYEPDRSVPFTAFARPRIHGAIRNALTKANEARAAYNARSRAERDRMTSLKRHAKERGGDDSIDALRQVIVGMALGFMLEDDADQEARQIPSKEPSAYESVAWMQAVEAMKEKLANLPERERQVVDYHYNRGLLFSEIATLFGVTQGRISQIHSSALARLRKSLARFR